MKVHATRHIMLPTAIEGMTQMTNNEEVTDDALGTANDFFKSC
jgi:hypothetical protein